MSNSCVIINENYCVYANRNTIESELDATPHAPIQALIAARRADIEGGTAFVSCFPCYTCAKALAASGIRKLVYKNTTNFDERALRILNLSQIELIQNENLEVGE